MAWKAILVSVQDVAPNDTININVQFIESVTQRQFAKDYNLHAASFTSMQALKDMIVVELDRLTVFDQTVQAIKGFIGREIK